MSRATDNISEQEEEKPYFTNTGLFSQYISNTLRSLMSQSQTLYNPTMPIVFNRFLSSSNSHHLENLPTPDQFISNRISGLLWRNPSEDHPKGIALAYVTHNSDQCLSRVMGGYMTYINSEDFKSNSLDTPIITYEQDPTTNVITTKLISPLHLQTYLLEIEHQKSVNSKVELAVMQKNHRLKELTNELEKTKKSLTTSKNKTKTTSEQLTTSKSENQDHTDQIVLQTKALKKSGRALRTTEKNIRDTKEKHIKLQKKHSALQKESAASSLEQQNIINRMAREIEALKQKGSTSAASLRGRKRKAAAHTNVSTLGNIKPDTKLPDTPRQQKKSKKSAALFQPAPSEAETAIPKDEIVIDDLSFESSETKFKVTHERKSSLISGNG